MVKIQNNQIGGLIIPKKRRRNIRSVKSQGKILLIVKMLKKLPELLVEPMALCLKYLRLSQLNMISNMD